MTTEPDRLERLARQDQPGLAAEFFAFLRENKKWWLLPILLLIALFGLFALANPAYMPFIYTMF